MQTIVKEKDNGKRSARHFTFGDRCGHLMRSLLPLPFCAAAAATCRFTIQGPESVGESGKNWGQWIRTRIQTNGERIFGATWQGNIGRKWISADSERAANQILGCFAGITTDEIFAHFGVPNIGEKYDIDLLDVVTALRPGLLGQTDHHACDTCSMAGTLLAV